MTEVSWIQRIALAVMIVTSAAIFWTRLSVVLDIIRRSKKTTDFEVSPLGPRIRDFFWEVVAQAKVDEGPFFRRFRPKDRGRAHEILKRTSHLTVVVEER